MASSKRVVLCADDFGLSEGVSAGILDLVHGGRISATSALTNRPGWDRHAPDLRAEGGRIGVGLHFNLTYGAPLGPMPQWAPRGRFPNVGVVTRRALTGSLPLREIEAELKRQLEAFTTGFGRGPDFVDGHQHVHALPGIRAVVLAVLAARAGPRPWLRDPTASLGVLLGQPTLAKAAAVGALSLGFRGSARRAGFETNEGFSGFSASTATRTSPACSSGPSRDSGPVPSSCAIPVAARPGRTRLTRWSRAGRANSRTCSPQLSANCWSAAI